MFKFLVKYLISGHHIKGWSCKTIREPDNTKPGAFRVFFEATGPHDYVNRKSIRIKFGLKLDPFWTVNSPYYTFPDDQISFNYSGTNATADNEQPLPGFEIDGAGGGGQGIISSPLGVLYSRIK